MTAIEPTEAMIEVMQEVYREGFRNGFVEAAVTEDGFPDEATTLKRLDEVSMCEGWDASEDRFKAELEALRSSAPQEPDDALIGRLQQLLPTLAEQWPHAELIVRSAIDRLQPRKYAQPCFDHEYITPGCPDCGKLA